MPLGLRSKKALLVWILLVLLRLLVALSSTSAIHPDEHFQNPEVAAGLLYDYNATGNALLKTWEWIGDKPCRSIAPVWGSTGLAFALLRWTVGEAPSGRALFVAQRLSMWLLSLFIDYFLWSISHSSLALLLFASSPVTLTFLLRPFSNSLETFLLAAAFCLADRILRQTRMRLNHPHMLALGAVLALGVWTRVTFVAFAAPIVISVALQAARTPSREPWSRRPLQFATSVFPTVASFAATGLALAIMDTIHFSPSLSSSSSLSSVLRTPLILTPLNLLNYNLAPSNLAEHGLHPRYLHLVANWPMLFGVGLWAVADVAWRLIVVKGAAPKEERRQRGLLYLASFVVPTLLLSIQPHQEPRFLVPLIIPLALLAPSASIFKLGTTGARRKRTFFWSIWIVHSLIFTTLFGYLHQGGLVPTLLKLNDELRIPGLPFLSGVDGVAAPARVELVFWKTFMPPRHLVLPLMNDASSAPIIRITDLSGAPPSQVLSTIRSLAPAPDSSTNSTTLLITPAYLFDAAEKELRSFGGEVDWRPEQMFAGRTFGVHVDMDRLNAIVGERWERMGVGVWQV